MTPFAAAVTITSLQLTANVTENLPFRICFLRKVALLFLISEIMEDLSARMKEHSESTHLNIQMQQYLKHGEDITISLHDKVRRVSAQTFTI